METIILLFLNMPVYAERFEPDHTGSQIYLALIFLYVLMQGTKCVVY
jgi:hypothetical protein